MRNNKGYALITTIFVLALLLPLSVAMFQIGLYQVKQTSQASWKQRTFHAADGMVDWTLANLPEEIAIGDSVYIGKMRVGSGVMGESWIRRIDNDTLDIRREFTVYGHGFTLSGIETTVALNTAVRGRPLWNIPTAFGAFGGMTKHGKSGIVSGVDECGVEPTTYGMWTPTDEAYQQHSVIDPNDPPDWLVGNPALQYSDDMVGEAGLVEWEDILTAPADYELSSASEWPSPSAFLDGWPVIRLTDDFSDKLNSYHGRGILIVPEDVTIGGGFSWDGIIMVGSNLTINGTVDIHGTVWTGVNITIPTGPSVDINDLGNGTQTFIYNSCYVNAALRAFRPVRVDTDWRYSHGGWTEF